MAYVVEISILVTVVVLAIMMQLEVDYEPLIVKKSVVVQATDVELFKFIADVPNYNKVSIIHSFIKLYFHKYKHKTKTFTHKLLKQSVEGQSKGQIGQQVLSPRQNIQSHTSRFLGAGLNQPHT